MNKIFEKMTKKQPDNWSYRESWWRLFVWLIVWSSTVVVPFDWFISYFFLIDWLIVWGSTVVIPLIDWLICYLFWLFGVRVRFDVVCLNDCFGFDCNRNFWLIGRFFLDCLLVCLNDWLTVVILFCRSQHWCWRWNLLLHLGNKLFLENFF